MRGIWVGVASVRWMLDEEFGGVEGSLVGCGAAFAAALSEGLPWEGFGLGFG